MSMIKATNASIEAKIAKGWKPNMYLTNMSVAYFQPDDWYVSPFIFPILPVSTSVGRYKIFDKGDLARDNVQRKPEFGKVTPMLFGSKEDLMEKIDNVLGLKNVLYTDLYKVEPLDCEEIYAKLMEYKELIAPYVADTFTILHNAVKEGKTILLEGQLGSLKDPDLGIYPMVTSSSPVAGFGAVGAGGIPPYEIKEIYTVVKAYSSAVGAGEFVSEIFGDEADELRRRGGDGGEFGATTGRPRRMGWLDLVATRYGCEAQGTTAVAFTVLDVLGYLDEIPVCVAYELDGKRIEYFPTTSRLKHCKPVIEVLPGWKCDIRGIKKYEDLPENTRRYIEFAEKAIGVPVKIVSNGPAREDIIYR